MVPRIRAAAVVVLVALSGCGRDDAAPAPAAPVPPPKPATDPRLRDDLGGFVPSNELIEAASAFGAPTHRDAAKAALDAMTPQMRVDVLRAGLRLRDDAAARVCAAHLTWEQLDRWECARCVDLLMADALAPASEVDFDAFRSYLGSVELSPFLRALPTPPWSRTPDQVMGDLHRISRSVGLPAYLEVARRGDAALSDAVWSNISLLGRWNDEFREDVAREEIQNLGVSLPDAVNPEPGLSPVLAAWLRATYLDPGPQVVNDETYLVWNEKIRWCWDSTPGPKDAELLMALTSRGVVNWQQVAGIAYALLGKLHDDASDQFLREKAEDEQAARWALARRGDGPMIERLVADARKDDEFALALLMEADPKRARSLVDEVLLGPNDEAADAMLDRFQEDFAPGAFFESCGFDWRRTSFEGFHQAAVAAGIPALRLARIGALVPGCRTRLLAKAVAARLRPGDLSSETQQDLDPSELKDLGGFLETAAPDELREALRRICNAHGDDAQRATRWLVRLGDADAATEYLAAGYDVGWLTWSELARTRSPEVRRVLEGRIGEWLRSGPEDKPPAEEVQALAVFHGLPEDAFWFDPLPRSAIDLVLAARPVDAVAAILDAAPDQPHGDVGAIDDPRVRAYLARLRTRRDLDHYWYATAQLAALGDSDARADFWGAMQDGRYRIMNDDADRFERTLGWKIPETMPFWIDELRSQCCRIVTSGAGDIVEELLGVSCFQSPWRTAHRRAKALWDSAGGRFVKSRIANLWVPAPR